MTDNSDRLFLEEFGTGILVFITGTERILRLLSIDLHKSSLSDDHVLAAHI